MYNVKINLQILIESLVKKIGYMQEINQYTKEQERLLKEEEVNYKQFNNIMQNKQVRIDKIVELDDGFEPAYERVRGALNTQPKLYKEEISKMKELIKEISDLGVEIQVLERRNKMQFDTKTISSKNKVKTYRRNKTAVTNYYDSIKKQNKDDNSYFFDSKK